MYYGPAKSGKTTNLEQVHSNVQVPESSAKGKLTSLATSSDRTLFFDFFPLEAVAIRGFKTKFALFTVPGQVIYNATRQIVLRGVDGIVFVADSQYDKMEENVETFKHLEENLKTLNLNLADIPLCDAVQQARPARRGADRIHGLRAQQPRSAGAFLRGLAPRKPKASSRR